MTEILHSPGVLALELSQAGAPARLSLSRDEAAELAAHIAADLARLLPAGPAGPGADVADLIVLGALYDHAQLLRPGWPLYAELAQLSQPNPALQDSGERRVIAFGSHADAMPTPLLTPEAGLGGGAMLLLPWMLSGPETLVQQLGQRMERDFVARGEAGSRTADFLMRTLGMRLEHARYLTRHDVCALTCVQMEHVGFSALWQMLELALLSPERSGSALTSRGRSLRYADGAVHCALPVYTDWLAAHGHALAPAERAHAYAGWLFELRQCAALLAAHDLPLRFENDAGYAGLPLQAIAAADPALPPAQLYAHEARGLGLVVISVAQPQVQAAPRLLAQAWPVDPAQLDTALAQLAARYGAAPALQRLGCILLDATASDLGVPDAGISLH